jgi:hypothetical protein
MKNKKWILIISVILLASCSNLYQKDIPSTAQEAIMQNESTEWDLVVISDSSGWGIAEKLAPMFAEELEIQVNAIEVSKGGLTAAEALHALKGEDTTHNAKFQALPETIKNAEIVVFFANPVESIDSENPGDWECYSEVDAYVKSCSLETFGQYMQDYEDIITEIKSLRKNEPLMLRLYTIWARPDWWEQYEAYDECAPCVETFFSSIQTVGEKFGIPVAITADVFNGAGHDRNPEDFGFIGNDGIHANDQGMEALARMIFELGFDLTH